MRTHQMEWLCDACNPRNDQCFPAVLGSSVTGDDCTERELYTGCHIPVMQAGYDCAVRPQLPKPLQFPCLRLRSSQSEQEYKSLWFLQMPGAGFEPAWGCPRGILSPLCIPVPPPGQAVQCMWLAVIASAQQMQLSQETVTRLVFDLTAFSMTL